MKTENLIFFFVVTILLNACYSYKIYPKEYRKLENLAVKQNAFLINDDLNKEVEILKSSDLFNFTIDSLKANLKIKLYPINKQWTCGQPIIASMVTLGQLPVYFPDLYQFKFDEIKQDTIVEKRFELKIAQRIWFWDMFGFNKRFEEKAGKALLGDYLNNTN